MTSGHGDHGTLWMPALATLLPAGGYLLLVLRAHRRNPARRWAVRRTALFLSGCALLAAALLPPAASAAHVDFRGHMAQHLVIGMYAPIALVLGAPVTLLLRCLTVSGARRLTRLLGTRPLRLVTHPVTALLLSTGSLVPLYFTPLYEITAGDPLLHGLLHVHFLLSGCLFAHAVAGPDPAPHRPGVPARLVVLGAAVAAHAVVAQLMYGGFLIEVRAPAAEIRAGATLMYYGGDIAELLLAVALVAAWRPVRSRPPVRAAPGV